MSERVCAVPGCNNVPEIRGVCIGCFKKHRAGGGEGERIKPYLETDPAKIRAGRHAAGTREPEVCPVPGCGKLVKTRGVCGSHYAAWKANPNGTTGRLVDPHILPSTKPWMSTATKGKHVGSKTRTKTKAPRKSPRANISSSEPSDEAPKGTMLNLPSVALRIREAVRLLTGNEAHLLSHEKGLLLVNPSNGKLVLLNGEGQIKQATIEIA